MVYFFASIEGVLETKRYLTSRFEMKNLDGVDTILALKLNDQVGVKHYVNPITLIKYSVSVIT